MAISLIRTVLLYFLVTIALRLMGKRQIGELEPSELVVTILISELAAIPMQDVTIPLFAGVIPMFCLVAIEILISFLCLKSRKARRIFNGQSAIVIRHGKLERKKMSDLRITTDEILEALLQNNISSPSQVKYGIIEPSGNLSYILYPKYQQATAEMIGYEPTPSGIPLIVVSDGKPILTNIKLLNLEVEDINKKIKKANIPSMNDIFIMTLDDCGNQFIQKKEN